MPDERPRLSSVFAVDLQGLSFDEPLPPRLVLQGPNGSGKTARLRAIDFALRGFPNKDGLSALTSAPLALVGVRTTTGFAVSRTTRIRTGAEPGTISVANEHAVDPPMGEKTEEAVAVRVGRELAPNVIALSLDRLFGLSGKERRRALLDALGAGSGLDALAALARLSTKFGSVEAATGQPSNVVWGTVKNAVARSAVRGGDAIEFLGLVEAAAKAQASSARTDKAASEAVARGATPEEPQGNAEEVALGIAAVEEEIEALVKAEEAAQARGEERARLERDVLRQKALLPPAVQAAYPDGAEEVAAAGVAKATEEVETKEDLLAAAAIRLTEADKAREAARAAASRAEGRHSALKILYAKDTDACPACGTSPFDAKKLEAMGKRAGKAAEAAEKERVAASAAYRVASDAEEAAREAYDAAIDAQGVAEKVSGTIACLRELDGDLAKTTAAADAGFSPEVLASARERRQALREREKAISSSQGERKARAEAGARAESADRRRRDAEAVQEEAGPSGMQGALLASTVGKLQEAMNGVWETSGRGGTLEWRLADARGNPDAQLVLRNGAERPVLLSSLSGGERAYATVALVTALARARPAETSVLLLEAGELDRERLGQVLASIYPVEELANVVVATPLPSSLFAGSKWGWAIRFLAPIG